MQNCYAPAAMYWSNLPKQIYWTDPLATAARTSQDFSKGSPNGASKIKNL